MSGDFLDTNVFVYAFDGAEPRKQQIAQTIVAGAVRDGTGSISHQVIQETLRVLTGKTRFGVSPSAAAEYLERMLMPLWHGPPHASTFHRCLDIQARYGFSFYDSLIVAAALEAGCDRILTEDLQHGQRIESLVIEDPFRQ